MIKPIARVLVTASAALTLAVGPLAGSATASSGPVYTQANNKQTVSLSEGTVFKVRLKACEDCGDSWHWKVRPDAHIVKVLRKKDVSSAKPPAVGGINTITWTMKVVGSGDTEIMLVKRSAQQSNKVVKRFTLYVASGPGTQLPGTG